MLPLTGAPRILPVTGETYLKIVWKRITRQASWTKPRKFWAWYSQRTRMRCCHWIQAKKRSTSQRHVHVAAQPSSILRRRLRGAVGPVRRDHLGCRRGATLRPTDRCRRRDRLDQILWFGFDHVEIEAELHQADFVMVRGVRADRERQSVAIHYRHDFHAFSALCRPDLGAATFRHDKRRIDEAFFFIQRTPIAKFVGNVRQRATQDLIPAPGLKAPMHGFVVRIALRQHVPLRTSVQYPKDVFKHQTRRYRFASSSPVRNVLLRKMMPDPPPLLVSQPESFLPYSRSTTVNNFEIGF